MEPNTIEPGDQAEQERINGAGMPSVGRKKRSGKMVNIIGLTAIAGVGLVFALTTDFGKPVQAKKAKPVNAEVANRLAPLPIPDKPEPLAEPAAIALVPAAKAATPPTATTTPVRYSAAGQSVRRAPTWQERKMGFTDAPDGAGAVPNMVAAGNAASDAGSAAFPTDPTGSPATAPRPAPAVSDLAARLEPTTFRPARASRIPNREYMLFKGTGFDCILDTRLVSSLPGLAVCHTDEDVYSEAGVLLMAKNTVLTGEYSGGIRQGEARMFTLFNRVRTEDGNVVNIDSPATDPLGATGIEGWVDTQFAKRFGAAILISLMQDATAVAVASKSRGGGQNTLVLGNTAQTGGALAEKALESSVNIPPVLHVNYGARIRIVLARDLDFSSVYGLKLAAP